MPETLSVTQRRPGLHKEIIREVEELCEKVVSYILKYTAQPCLPPLNVYTNFTHCWCSIEIFEQQRIDGSKLSNS